MTWQVLVDRKLLTRLSRHAYALSFVDELHWRKRDLARKDSELASAALSQPPAEPERALEALATVLSACQLQQTPYPECRPYMTLSMEAFEAARAALTPPPAQAPASAGGEG